MKTSFEDAARISLTEEKVKTQTAISTGTKLEIVGEK
ncbi:hypothetical protein CPELA_10100 [Corynebacterium pelargi]|uniref:Uncharacterized protein n=1 Tax=Corynebacterium pelargi TaxID=1471400 RepID=A0A410WBD8_9CORY|nr:hypothetical protein CPELA_10100 [Corynebacterium pelargi]